MTDTASAPTSVTITVRPLPAEKQRFTSLARHRGLSEAQLALEAVRFFLKLQAPQWESAAAAPMVRVPATARLTIRLRPGDRRAIAERSRLRRMADSAYVAARIRCARRITSKATCPCSTTPRTKIRRQQNSGGSAWHRNVR